MIDDAIVSRTPYRTLGLTDCLPVGVGAPTVGYPTGITARNTTRKDD